MNATERMQQTAEWLGATPVDQFGSNLLPELSPGTPDYEAATAIANSIRAAVSQGITRVEVAERHIPTLNLIFQQLTEEERACVVCHLSRYVPPAMSEPLPSSPPEPNIVKPEDGSLRAE